MAMGDRQVFRLLVMGRYINWIGTHTQRSSSLLRRLLKKDFLDILEGLSFQSASFKRCEFQKLTPE